MGMKYGDLKTGNLLPVWKGDVYKRQAESVQDAESSLFGMEDSELTEDTMPAFADMEEDVYKRQGDYGESTGSYHCGTVWPGRTDEIRNWKMEKI